MEVRGPSPLWVAPFPRQVGMTCIRKLSVLGRGTQPGRSIPQWALLELLPPGSCPGCPQGWVVTWICKTNQTCLSSVLVLNTCCCDYQSRMCASRAQAVASHGLPFLSGQIYSPVSNFLSRAWRGFPRCDLPCCYPAGKDITYLNLSFLSPCGRKDSLACLQPAWKGLASC